MNPAILRIKEAAPLPVVAGEYVKLRKAGSSWIGLCPFHKEKTGSLRVHDQYFKCFGCGTGGDVITFISRIEGISIGSALRLLSDRTGIPLDPQALPRTRLQRAYDADEQAFAEWWVSRAIESMGRKLSKYVSLLDRLTTEADCDAIGEPLRKLRGLPRSQWRSVALRCATTEEREQWHEDLLSAKEFIQIYSEIIDQAHISGMGEKEFFGDYHARVACGPDCKWHPREALRAA